MSFDFSDLVIPDDGNENDSNYDYSQLFDDNYDYSQFLADPIYDWLNSPEEILQVCDTIEDKQNTKRKVTIIQQPQPQHTQCKKPSYRRGPYRKKKDRNN
jgi:hypothetical protein